MTASWHQGGDFTLCIVRAGVTEINHIVRGGQVDTILKYSGKSCEIEVWLYVDTNDEFIVVIVMVWRV